MKSQSLWLVAVSLVLVALLSWLFFFRQPQLEDQIEDQISKHPSKPAELSTVPGQEPQPVFGSKAKSKTEKIREALSLLNNQPIEFYGKAVDQHGEPVAGAEVIAHLLMNDGTRQGWEEKRTVTGGNGDFEFKGFNGESISVEIKKQGYEQNFDDNTFEFSLLYRDKVHKPNSTQPVIFKLWKLQGPEPMIEDSKFYGITPDGRPYTIDLVGGKKVEGRSKEGDLVVQIHRPLNVVPKTTYDWTFELTGIGGGLLEIDEKEVFPYLAPESGYREASLHIVAASDPSWSERVKKQFYIKSRDGKVYARAEVEVFSNYQKEGVFRIRCYVNPSGSRNLEWDPKKRLTKGEISKLGAALTSD